MKTKVLITLRGGMVEEVHSNHDIEYVVVDYDLVDQGQCPVHGPREQDSKVDNFHELFTDKTEPVDMEIYHELKRYHF